MKFRKNINHNSIAILGTWDPVLPRHKVLFKQLLSYSKKQGLNPYVVIIYPSPSKFIYDNYYRDYFDLNARIELFKHFGINNIIVIDFKRQDLQSGIGDFFNELSKDRNITLKELWVGENQSLGKRAGGSISGIIEACSDRNIKLRILKNSFLVTIDKDVVYKTIEEGKFSLTAETVGYFPTYKLKTGLPIDMYDGIYIAKLRTDPFKKTNEIAVTVKITKGKLEKFKMVDGYDWLILLGKVGGERDSSWEWTVSSRSF
jgi:FAD synthase